MAKNKKKKTVIINDTYDRKTITKVVSIIILIFMIVYMITSLIINKYNFNNSDNNEKAEIQYEEIIAGDIFNQGDEQYYIMLYDFEKNDAKYINLIINNKLSGEDALPVYKVDLGNGFNKIIVGDKSNQTNDITQLKVSGTTVIRIHNKKIELFIEGIDEIKKYFGY
jgi:uncharacterized membrane protein